MEIENIKHQVEELQVNSNLITQDISRMLPTIIRFLEENGKLLKEFHELREKDLEIRSKLIDYIKKSYGAIDNYVRDYGNLEDLTHNIVKITRKDYAELEKKIARFKESAEKIPQETEVKIHHGLDLKSAKTILSIATLAVLSLVSLGFSIGLYQTQKSLRADNIKLRMFRQEFPNIGLKIDSIYHADPQKAEYILNTIEEEQRLLQAAKEKRKEIESAR